MKINIPANYNRYTILYRIVILLLFVLVSGVAYCFEIVKSLTWYKLILFVPVIMILNIIPYIFFYEKIRVGRYLLLDSRNIEYHEISSTLIFKRKTFFKKEHVLSYKISQNIFMKKFNIYKIFITTPSINKYFFVSGEEIQILEKEIMLAISKGLCFVEEENGYE